MSSLVLRKEVQPVPLKNQRSYIDSYEGFLNSSYKQVARKNFETVDSKSLFGIKQRIRTFHFSKERPTVTIVKLSAFLLILVAIMI